MLDPRPEMDLERTIEDASMARALSRTFMRRLLPREERVIRLYYFEQRTLDDIALMFGVSKERARRIRLNAENKLWRNKHCRNMARLLKITVDTPWLSI